MNPPIQRCMHGMVTGTCGICNRKKQEPIEHRTPTKKPAQPERVHVVSTPPASEERGDPLFTVIFSLRAKETGYLEDRLGPEIVQIHLTGIPFVWLLQRIIAECPSLRVLQTIESNRLYLERGEAAELLKKAHFRVQYGTVRKAWDQARKDSPSSKQYSGQQRFLQTLAGDQKALWDELLRFGIEAAEITARYFCLNGETFIPLGKLAVLYGFAENVSLGSQFVNAVLHYLDPTFKCAREAKRRAASIETTVRVTRELTSGLDVIQRLCTELRIQNLPDKLPLSKWQLFRQIRLAYNAGRFSIFTEDRARDGEILKERYGIPEGPFKSLGDIGLAQSPQLSHERIRQLEERALSALGITVEE